MNSYPYKFISFESYSIIYLLQQFLGTDAMTSKDTKHRLIQENKNRPQDPDILDVRRQFQLDPPRQI